MAINGLALGSVAVGSIFVYSAIKGKSVLAVAQAIITGQTPANTSQTNPITEVNTGGAQTIGGTPPSNPHGHYTQQEVIALWTQLGGNPAAAQNASCHAMQESGGDPMITSSNPDGGINVGLFQLDTKGVGAGHSVAELQNATLNTQITIRATNNGTNWSQWATPGC